jgi:hypothetical protein
MIRTLRRNSGTSPERALALCCDEKSSCQALERTQRPLTLKKGYGRTQTHDYIRHGTITLFAALSYLEGKIISRTEKCHTHLEWLRFLKQIDRETPKHLICTSLSITARRISTQRGGLFFVEAGDANTLTFPLKGRLEPIANKYIDKNIVFGIRPEHITNEPKEGSSVPVTLTVDISEPMGSESLVYLRAGTGNLIARIHGEHLFHLGEQVTVQLDLEKVSLFDVESEK